MSQPYSPLLLARPHSSSLISPLSSLIHLSFTSLRELPLSNSFTPPPSLLLPFFSPLQSLPSLVHYYYFPEPGSVLACAPASTYNTSANDNGVFLSAIRTERTQARPVCHSGCCSDRQPFSSGNDLQPHLLLHLVERVFFSKCNTYLLTIN